MKHKMKDGREVELREVKVTDATLLLEYFELVNLESKNLLREPGEYTFTVREERNFIRKILNSDNESMAVVIYDDEIIGSIGFRSSPLKRITHRGSLGMSVRKKYNNLGVGSLMMEYIIKRAKELKKNKIRIRSSC